MKRTHGLFYVLLLAVAVVSTLGCPKVVTKGPPPETPKGPEFGILAGNIKLVFDGYKDMNKTVTAGIKVDVLQLNGSSVEKVHSAKADKKGYYFVANLPVDKGYSQGKVTMVDGQSFGTNQRPLMGIRFDPAKRSSSMALVFVFTKDNVDIDFDGTAAAPLDWFVKAYPDSGWTEIIKHDR